MEFYFFHNNYFSFDLGINRCFHAIMQLLSRKDIQVMILYQKEVEYLMVSPSPDKQINEKKG